MNFKRNLIVILILVNLLILLFILFKSEKFTDVAALIDPKLKNKIKIESNVLVDANEPIDTIKQNAELFIDGDVSIGGNREGELPSLCFGNKCYTNKDIKDFLKYNIPYEVFDTEPIEQKTPDKLCYSIQGAEPNCISGDDLKLLNGKQYIYLAGPDYNNRSSTFSTKNHLQSNRGAAPHYYYDINNNYYGKIGKKDKDPSELYAHPDCVGRGYFNRKVNDGTYGNTGVDRVPYFYNLNMLNGIPTEVKNSIKVDKNKTAAQYKCAKPNWGGVESDRCGDGILQMVKHPVHKRKGVNYDNMHASVHNGHKGRCKGTNMYDMQIMNMAAVNLLPEGFNGLVNDPNLGAVNVRDQIRYKLVPGAKTGLKCYS